MQLIWICVNEGEKAAEKFQHIFKSSSLENLFKKTLKYLENFNYQNIYFINKVWSQIILLVDLRLSLPTQTFHEGVSLSVLFTTYIPIALNSA